LKVDIPACGGNALSSVRWKEWRRSRIVSRLSWARLHRYAKHCGQRANPSMPLEGDVEEFATPFLAMPQRWRN